MGFCGRALSLSQCRAYKGTRHPLKSITYSKASATIMAAREAAHCDPLLNLPMKTPPNSPTLSPLAALDDGYAEEILMHLRQLAVDGDASARDAKRGEETLDKMYAYLLLSHFSCLYDTGMIVNFNSYPRLAKLWDGPGRLKKRTPYRLPHPATILRLKFRVDFTLDKVLAYCISYGVHGYARKWKIRMCKMLLKKYMSRCAMNTTNCYATVHGTFKLVK